MPRPRLSPNATLAIAVVALAVILGAGIAIASSPGSLSASTTRSGALTTPTPTATPTATPTPEPSPTPGVLGQSVRLIAGSGFALATSPAGAYRSTDGGATWTALKPPGGTATVVADPAAANHLIAGGTALLSTRDGGRTWTPPRTRPPGTGPIQPLWINPFDGSAWLIVHGGRLIRTRDDGISWREVVTPVPLTAPLAVEGAAQDQAYVADGGRVLQVDGNGDRVTDRGSLPGGAAVASLAVLTTAGALLAEAAGGAVYENAGGTAWTATRQSGPVAALAGRVAWLGGADPALSTDGAKTWTPLTGLPANDPPLAFASDGSRTYAYTLSGTVYTSPDSGRTWTRSGHLS